MDYTWVGGLMLVALFVQLLAGVPIAFALGLSGVMGLTITRPWNGTEFLLGAFPFSASSNLAYVILPLFLFMGNMAFAAGVASKAYEAAKAWVGGLTGGLAIATVFACAAFATVSGSSVATAATVAQVAIPEMLKANYSQRIASACVVAGGTLGVLIPPSGILVVYSIVTEVPVSDLFIAAFVPGIITAIAYSLMLYFWVRSSPELKAATLQKPLPLNMRFRKLAASWEVIVLFMAVMVPMYFGFSTATEAAAFGACGALLIVLFLRRTGRWKILWRGLVDTGVATSSIFALIIGAGLFSLGLSTTQIPQNLALWAGGFHLATWQLTLLLLVPYLILGCFVDGVSMLLLTLPVLFPVIKQAGINPVLFGILICKTIEVGAIHPPVGLNLFVVKNVVPDLDLTETFKGVIPFILMDFALIFLLVAFPEIVTFPLAKGHH
jgi:C4-dicarboxylate transporter DctM subunit